MSEPIEYAIESKIEQFLQPYLAKFHEYKIYSYDGTIDVKGTVNENDAGKTLVLKVLFSHENKQVAIPNIFMPEFMKRQGIGKRLIFIIHQELKKHGYQLFIIDLVQSFYDKLVQRGAIVCEEGDIVLITDETRLT